MSVCTYHVDDQITDVAAQIIRDHLERGRYVYIDNGEKTARAIAAKRKGDITFVRHISGAWARLQHGQQIRVEQ